jgi:catechol 2,3-dioxygenase-like lactoylglutathione lyase family enzyme
MNRFYPLVALLGCVLIPSSASAQAVITGVVKDAASVALATVPAAQGGPGSGNAATAEVLAAAGVTPIVGNLEEAARFYAELVGLPNTPPIRRRSHSDVPYPEVLKNQGTPDATIRQINLNIPGSAWRVEVLEFSDIESKAVAARIQDPGAMTIVLSVRDVDGLLAKLRNLKGQVVTPGGAPVAVTVGTNRARAVLIKAPGGHFIELRQPDPLPADPALPAGNVIGGHIRVTIADTDATLRLYRDKLGLRPDVGPFTSDASRLRLMGTAGAQFRVTSTPLPGGAHHILEFIEFKAIDRTPLHTRIQDPGSSKIALRVRDLPAALAAFTAAGGVVTTTGGKPYLYNDVPTVIVRDLNNMFMNMQQAAEPAARTANR